MNKRWTLQKKFLVLISILVTLMMLLVAFVYISFERAQIRELVGEQALSAAITISEIPQVKEVVATEGDPYHIQPYVETIREKIEAEFIVVGDRNEIRYTHPNPEQIGEVMVGGDNERALKFGESYTSVAEGSLGTSVRGKTPIIVHGEIVGVVSVGFLISHIDTLLTQGLTGFLVWLGLILIVGMVGSYVLARSIQKDTFGLEPYQIARFYKERGAILESINEGLIATDQTGKVTLVNRSAKEILQLSDDVVGKPIGEVLPNTELAHVLQDKDADGAYETTINGKALLISYKFIDDEGDYGGKVASFQVRSDVQELIHTLSEVQQYSQDLRAQTHEYTNKLYVISGWLQLGHVDKAKQFIHEEMGKQHDYEKVIFDQIKDPTIQAILIAKLAKASEKKVSFTINENSHVEHTWPDDVTSQLVTILGNILDNALEAVADEQNPQVTLFMTDIGNDLVIEVSDNGKGIESEAMTQIFDLGYTTKNAKEHGYGLTLVQSALAELGGTLEFDRNHPKGTIFSIYIPKIGGGLS